MKTENKIVDAWTAIVNGKETALAGCDVDCMLKSHCLRSDKRLSYRENQYKDLGYDCSVFIPIAGSIYSDGVIYTNHQ